MKLSPDKELEFTRLFKEKHGVDPIHASVKFSQWGIAVWNDIDISSIVAKPTHVMSELDSLWSELRNTDRNTVVRPVLSEYRSSAIAEPIIYDKRVDNILTNLGMKNMGELSTAQSVKTNTHCYAGDDNTGEQVGDDQLGNQIAAKDYDTDGSRETVDQQERYAMAFFRSDFASDVILKEAGYGTGAAPPSDVLVTHVTFGDKPIGTGQTMTVQITVTHKNGTQ